MDIYIIHNSSYLKMLFHNNIYNLSTYTIVGCPTTGTPTDHENRGPNSPYKFSCGHACALPLHLLSMGLKDSRQLPLHLDGGFKSPYSHDYLGSQGSDSKVFYIYHLSYAYLINVTGGTTPLREKKLHCCP